MWLADGWKDYEVIDSPDHLAQTNAGNIRTHTITAVKKAAVNGNSSISRNSGKSVIRILPLT